MAGSNASRFLLRFAVTVVLARILTPEEFGVVAMMTAVFAVGAVFQEMGLSAATVQRPVISPGALSTLFWINTALGAGLTVVFALGAGLIASFYSRPELTALCVAGSLTFLLNGAAVQPRALLQRQMRFGAHAGINVLAPLLGGVAAIVMALLGAGMWSLLVQVLLTDALTLVLLWRVAPIPWLRPRLDDEVRSMLRFGVSLFGFHLVYGVALSLYVILLGRVSGAVATGLYTRAHALAAIPQGFVYMAAGHVALPKLSSLSGQSQAFAAFYYRGVQLTALVNAPVVLLFLLFAEDLSAWAYGAQWQEVPALLRIFAVGLIAPPLLHSTSQVFAARGEGDRFFRWGLVSAGVMALTALVGLRWGVQGVAWGWSASSLILLLPGLGYAFRGTPLSVGESLRCCLGPYGAAVLAAPLGWAAGQALAHGSTWWRLPIGTAVYGLAYLGAAYFVFGQRDLILDVWRRVRGGRS